MCERAPGSRNWKDCHLVANLRAKGLTSKVRKLSSGAIRMGVPFTQGPLFYMLRNRFYIGEVTFKGEVHNRRCLSDPWSRPSKPS
jgi:hypothetical protein